MDFPTHQGLIPTRTSASKPDNQETSQILVSTVVPMRDLERLEHFYQLCPYRLEIQIEIGDIHGMAYSKRTSNIYAGDV